MNPDLHQDIVSLGFIKTCRSRPRVLGQNRAATPACPAKSIFIAMHGRRVNVAGVTVST